MFVIISPKINPSANSVNFGFLPDSSCLLTKNYFNHTSFFSVIDVWSWHANLIFLKDFIRRHASIKHILNRFLFFIVISYLQYFYSFSVLFVHFSLESFFSFSFAFSNVCITADSTSFWFAISDYISIFSWTSTSNCTFSDFFLSSFSPHKWLFIFYSFLSLIIFFCFFSFVDLPFSVSSSNSSSALLNIIEVDN